MVEEAHGGDSTGDLLGLTPERRVLWDTFDVTMREAVEHERFGADEALVARSMSGVTVGPSVSLSALALLGYSGVSEPVGMAAPPMPDPPPPPDDESTLGCWPFDPDRDGCGTDCIDEMFSDSSGYCYTFFSCDPSTRSVSSSELADLEDEVDGDTLLGFKNGPRISGATDDEQDFVRAAWNLLLDNLDLVTWAVCRATGTVSTTEFGSLLDRINGAGLKRVTVQMTNMDGSYFALYGTSIVWISRKSSSFQNYLAMWTDGSHDERLCAALDFGATLLHELTHLAGYTYADLGSRCYASYMIENAYRWGLFHRYEDAAGADCCGDLDDDSVYGCGSSIYPDTGCVSSSSADSETGFVDVLRFLWNGVRLIVGGIIGAIRAGAEWLWEGFLGVVETVWEALGDAWDWVKDTASDAWDWVTETAGDAWERIKGWLGDVFDTGGGSGGGCCYCACNECYDYCPDLWHNDCACTPKVEWDDEDLLACMARCAEGLIEEMIPPAETMSATGD